MAPRTRDRGYPLPPLGPILSDESDERGKHALGRRHNHRYAGSAQHWIERRGELRKIAREAGTPSRLVRSNPLLDGTVLLETRVPTSCITEPLPLAPIFFIHIHEPNRSDRPLGPIVCPC